AIARSLQIANSRILILDEPTSRLDVNESNRLFEVMRKLKGEGMGIVFVTHFLDQVYRVSDRATVLRTGNLVATDDLISLPRIELVAKMLGRSVTELDAIAQESSQVDKKLESKAVIQAKGLGLK